MTSVLMLPGLYNSGPEHWQTLWQQSMPNARRVQQRDWDAPDRADWVAALDAAIRITEGPIVLVTHSLGCALAAWWAATHGDTPHARRVTGALLVAPPDVEREDFPSVVTGFVPMPRQPLPFTTIVAVSSDDPWCAPAKAQSWADGWKARCEHIGPCGHVNTASNLGDWPRGRRWLDELIAGA